MTRPRGSSGLCTRRRSGGRTATAAPSIALVVAILALLTSMARAQDSHYWDSQYGTKAELLGGLVVGAPTDLSATYYNPAWIAVRQEPSVLLTTRAIETYSVRLKNALGTDAEVQTRTTGTSPGYLAGRFSLGDGGGWVWAYTYLEKVRFRYDASDAVLDLDRSPPPDGLEWLALEAFLFADVNESWYGFSASRRLSDRVGIGFSPYLARRSQRARLELALQTLAGDGRSADLNYVDDYRYWHYRLLVKAGVALDGDWWTAGLTVTAPSLGLVGTGEVYDRAFTSGGYDPNDPTATEPYLQADRQKDLDAKWKSPLSIAVGGAWRLGATRIHLTAEWFDAVSRFEVLSPASYEIQSQPGEFQDYDLSFAAESIVNYGLGVERIFSPHFSLFTSYRLDQTTTSPEQSNRLNTSSWDLHHVTGGASFQLLSMEFTAGLQYSWGSSRVRTRLDLDSGLEDGDILSGKPGDLEFRRLKALLGFNLPFAIPTP